MKMEKEIIAGYLNEARLAALELSDFIRANVFRLTGRRRDLRLRYENMMAKIDKYEEAVARSLLTELKEERKTEARRGQ